VSRYVLLKKELALSLSRGHSHVSAEEIMEHYGGTHIPMHVMDRLPSSMNWKLTQFLDLFSIPEATLLADISEVGATYLCNCTPACTHTLNVNMCWGEVQFLG